MDLSELITYECDVTRPISGKDYSEFTPINTNLSVNKIIFNSQLFLKEGDHVRLFIINKELIKYPEFYKLSPTHSFSNKFFSSVNDDKKDNYNKLINASENKTPLLIELIEDKKVVHTFENKELLDLYSSSNLITRL